jgi:hypothetical protein
MGTRDGLNRYDGYDFIVYNYDENNPLTVSSNFINCLFEDSQVVSGWVPMPMEYVITVTIPIILHE